MLFVMKIKTDLIQGITKRSNLRSMEKCLFKVSFEMENSVKKYQGFKCKKENTCAFLE